MVEKEAKNVLAVWEDEMEEVVKKVIVIIVLVVVISFIEKFVCIMKFAMSRPDL